MAMELGMANQYVRDLSVNVKRGLRTMVLNGWLPGVAPFGYLNTKTSGKGANTLVKDPDRFLLIRKMWDLMLTGAYTPPQILDIANKEWGFRTRPLKHGGGGKPLCTSMIYRIFGNPFYFGVFEYNGEPHPGKHEPMISEEEFWRVQELLGRDGRPRPKSRRWFKYVGVIKCGGCGCMVTAETRVKRQKNGNVHTYVYYHCTKPTKPRCNQPSIEEKSLETEIDQIVADLDISPAFRDWAFAKLRRDNGKEAEAHSSILSAQQRAYKDVINKIDGLIDMRAAKEIDEDTFKTKTADLEDQRARLKKVLDETDTRVSNWLERAEKTFDFATNARENFKIAKPEKRREFVAALAEDSNLLLINKTLRFSKDNRFFVLRERLKDEPIVKSSFEPPETSEGRAFVDDLYDQSLTLRALLKVEPDGDAWRTGTYEGKDLWLIPNEVAGLTLLFPDDY